MADAVRRENLDMAGMKDGSALLVRGYMTIGSTISNRAGSIKRRWRWK